MEIVQNVTNAGAMLAVFVAVALRLRFSAPPLRWHEVLAVGIPSYVVLVFAGEMLSAAMVPWFAPLSDGGMFVLAMLPAALVAAGAGAALRWRAARKFLLLAPLAGLALLGMLTVALLGNEGAAFYLFVTLVVVGAAAALLTRVALRGLGTLRPASPWVVGVLILLALPAGFLEIALGLQEPQQARHAWSVEVAPEGDAPYALRVPFLVARVAEYDEEQALRDSARIQAALDRLRPLVRVEDGEATMAWIENDTALRIEGRGPARVGGVATVYGDSYHREIHAALPDNRVALAAGGPPAVRVLWSLHFSGGEGHACASWGDAAATVTAGGSANLTGPEMHESGLWFYGACP